MAIDPDVRLIGNVQLGQRVSICGPAELMAKYSRIKIGDDCDIAAFVVITTADSHLRCLGLLAENVRREIVIENNVFVGTGAIILGGSSIGHHSVIGAGVVLSGQKIPAWSKVTVGPPFISHRFYER